MGIQAHNEGFVYFEKADMFVQIALISLMRVMLTLLSVITDSLECSIILLYH